MSVRCPRCGKNEVHHSRARTGFERLRRRLTGRVPFRCYACGWRGWRHEVSAVPPDSLREIHKDLTDAELERLDPERGPQRGSRVGDSERGPQRGSRAGDSERREGERR